MSRTTRRRPLAVLATVAALSLVAACGGSDSETVSPDPASLIQSN